MDISTINDITTLKAYAYDEVVTLERAQNNLKLLNDRMAQLQKEEAAKEAAEKKTK